MVDARTLDHANRLAVETRAANDKHARDVGHRPRHLERVA
jgi:hypothetical protein